MTPVKTSEGVIECPDLQDVGPRTKYWAGVIRDVVRTEEMYMVMGAALEEAYKAGVIGGLARFMEGFTKMGEVIDVEANEVVEGDNQVVRDEGELEGAENVGRDGGSAGAETPATSGPEPAGPAEDDHERLSSGSVVSELPGSVSESSGS